MAVVVLFSLAVLAPWAFGGVTPLVEWVIGLVALASVALSALRGSPSRFGLPLALAGGLVCLGVFQLLPLPLAFHSLVAPASFDIWHPTEAAASQVLGERGSPISVLPDSTLRAVALGTGLLGMIGFSMPLLQRRRVLLASALAVVGSGVAMAVFAVVGRLVFGNRLYGVVPVPTVTPFGPFVSKNHFAGYVLVVALLALGLAFGFLDEAQRGSRRLDWISSRSAWKPLLAFGAAVVLGLSVLLSQSRGGAVSLAAGALAFPLLRARVRERRVEGRRLAAAVFLVLVVGASAFFVLPAGSRQRLATLTNARSDFSASYRLGIWADSLRAFAASPVLGYGLGTFGDALPPFKTGSGQLRVEHAENDYLEVLVESGMAGLLLALGAAAAFAWTVGRGLRLQQDRLARGIGLGATAGLVALAVHSTVDFNLRIPATALLASALVAATLATAEAIGSEPQGPPRRLGRALSSLAATTLLGSLIVTGVDGRGEPRLPSRVEAPLRLQALDEILVGDLRRKPTDARRWLALSWVRGVRGIAGASGLARHAAWCDPTSPVIRAESSRLETAFRSGEGQARPRDAWKGESR